jgi:NAD(P)-dependent dehydrogenase (short-subunit alcohol dehydrogenase family)/acyl carrier protein
VLWLAKALGDMRSSGVIRLGVVTTDVQSVTGAEPLCPAKATVIGPCRVVSAEYPHIRCRAVDLVASEWATPAEGWIARLAQELASDAGDGIAAFRSGRRWVQSADATPLPALQEDARPRLRERGVYVITGGLGGVGLTLAGYLARTVSARLVLIGRRALPPRDGWSAHVARHGSADRVSKQIRAVEALEAAGASVTVIGADVADAAQVRSAFDRTRREHGRIDGVIHAAGVAGGGVIALKTAEEVARVFAPKVAGTQALASALAGVEPDFFVLCSSMTSLIGGGGQVDYCGANTYLDAFARWHAQQTGGYTVAINWDAWRDVGMSVETASSGQMARVRAALLRHGITPAEGAEAFARILGRAEFPQVLVSTVPLDAIAARVEVRAEGQEQGREGAGPPAPGEDQLPRHDRPSLSVVYTAPTNDLEHAIAEIWQELLGVARIGIHDDFFELGGHSLLATQFGSRLRQTLDIEFALADLFHAPTVAGLSELFMARLLDQDAQGVGGQV